MRKSDTAADLLLARRRDEEILRLRLEQRLTYSKISSVVGVSTGQISKVLRRHLAVAAKIREELGVLLLDEEIAAVDSIWREAWQIVRDPEATIKNRIGALGVMDKAAGRRQRLLQLDTVKVSVDGGILLAPGEADAVVEACTDDEAKAIDRGDESPLRNVVARVRSKAV